MTLLVSDADNTLWDTNSLFARAQRTLMEQVLRAMRLSAPSSDPLAFLRSVDQEIARRHHQNLRYPPQLLVLALIDALAGVSPATAAQRAMRGDIQPPADVTVEGLAQSFLMTLRDGTPELREGVAAGLATLNEDGTFVLVATEGSHDKCEALLEFHKLRAFVERVVSAPKTEQLFKRLARLKNCEPADRFAVGDQLDRDIMPAKAARYTTILFRGGFEPNWMPRKDIISPDFEISNFEEVCQIIRANGVANHPASNDQG